MPDSPTPEYLSEFMPVYGPDSTPQPVLQLTREQRDILELLASELEEHLEAALELPAEPSIREVQARLERIHTDVENLGHAAQLIGLTGVAGVCVHLCHNVNELKIQPEAEGLAHLEAWPIYLLDYMQQLKEGYPNPDSISTLLGFLADACWPWPLPKVEQELLHAALKDPVISIADAEEEAPPVPHTATREMLSMTLNEDINPSLYEGLMLELPNHIEQFSRCLEEFSKDPDSDGLTQAQRIAHTVKGSANVVGVCGLANFMHYSEDLFDLLEREPLVSPVVRSLLIEMGDTLGSLFDHLLDATEPGDEDIATLQRIFDQYHWLKGDNDLAPSTDTTEHFDSTVAESQPNSYRSSSPSSSGPPTNPGLTNTSLTGAVLSNEESTNEETTSIRQEVKSQIRVDEQKIQGLLTLAGEASIGNHRIVNQTHIARQSAHQLQVLQKKLLQLTEELGELIEVRGLFSQPGTTSDKDDLDPLELDHYNELHSFYHQLQEFSADSRDLLQHTQGELRGLEELTQAQQVNHKESQQRLLDLLTLPANSLEARLQRCVRQACRLTGKQATLVMTGGECRLDSQTLQRLTDPLMHLLRNAVDHGIETSEERLTRGKTLEGLISLSFEPKGQGTLVCIQDDGAGLDRQRILRRAVALNLCEPDVDVNDQWLRSTLFLAGFSTRESVSQTSGRGVGLDVVAEQLEALKGRTEIHSPPGEGTRVTLEIPNTLIAEHQLLVALGEQQVAVSSRGIQQVLFMDPERLSNRGEQLYYDYQGEKLPVLHLAQIATTASMISAASTDTRRAQALLLLEIQPGKIYGLLIDRILASREMVIKPLSRFTPEVAGVLGATILGDGSVAPVLDALQLLQRALHQRSQQQDRVGEQNRIDDRNQVYQKLTSVELQQQLEQTRRPLALVIDDSLSSRRTIAQFVNDMGMDVVTARDGFEAIQKLQERQPTLVLVDMEMPRMNGLEFTAHLRAQKTLRDIPVIMITSRNTDKHRQLANAAGVDCYLNKPFSEDELMKSIQERLH